MLVGSGASGIADLMASMQCQGHRMPEFGSIVALGSSIGMVPDSMPTVTIPSNDDQPGGFMLVDGLRIGSVTTTPTMVSSFRTITPIGSAVTDHTHAMWEHTHASPDTGLNAGDRVVVMWCRDTPVILAKLSTLDTTAGVPLASVGGP